MMMERFHGDDFDAFDWRLRVHRRMQRREMMEQDVQRQARERDDEQRLLLRRILLEQLSSTLGGASVQGVEGGAGPSSGGAGMSAEELRARVEQCAEVYAEYKHIKLEVERVAQVRQAVASYQAHLVPSTHPHLGLSARTLGPLRPVSVLGAFHSGSPSAAAAAADGATLQRARVAAAAAAATTGVLDLDAYRPRPAATAGLATPGLERFGALSQLTQRTEPHHSALRLREQQQTLAGGDTAGPRASGFGTHTRAPDVLVRREVPSAGSEGAAQAGHGVDVAGQIASRLAVLETEIARLKNGELASLDIGDKLRAAGAQTVCSVLQKELPIAGTGAGSRAVKAGRRDEAEAAAGPEAPTSATAAGPSMPAQSAVLKRLGVSAEAGPRDAAARPHIHDYRYLLQRQPLRAPYFAAHAHLAPVAAAARSPLPAPPSSMLRRDLTWARPVIVGQTPAEQAEGDAADASSVADIAMLKELLLQVLDLSLASLRWNMSCKLVALGHLIGASPPRPAPSHLIGASSPRLPPT